MTAARCTRACSRNATRVQRGVVVRDPARVRAILRRAPLRSAARLRLVDGEAVRDRVDVDFTMGGSWARYSYVPRGEVWVDAHMTIGDQVATYVHEVVEARAMVDGGMTYDDAHEVANRAERKVRRGRR